MIDTLCSGGTFLMYQLTVDEAVLDIPIGLWILMVFFIGFAAKLVTNFPIYLVYYSFAKLLKKKLPEMLIFLPFGLAANAVMLLIFSNIGWDAMIAMVTGTMIARFLVLRYFEMIKVHY